MDDSNTPQGEEALALELADKLGDPKGLGTYRKIAREYLEPYIRSVLQQVLDVPQERVRTSRGAIFTWLIQHHADRSQNLRSSESDSD